MLIHDPLPGCSVGWKKTKFRNDNEYYVITAMIYIEPGPKSHEISIKETVDVAEANKCPEKLLIAFGRVVETMNRYRQMLQEGTFDPDIIFTKKETQE